MRKPLVLMVGGAVIAAGLVMLVFPGPGWAAIFLGLAILATEFAVAEKVRAWLVSEAKRQLQRLKERWRAYRNKNKQSVKHKNK